MIGRLNEDLDGAKLSFIYFEKETEKQFTTMKKKNFILLWWETIFGAFLPPQLAFICAKQ